MIDIERIARKCGIAAESWMNEEARPTQWHATPEQLRAFADSVVAEASGDVYEELAECYVKLSGKKYHLPSCATGRAPSYKPGPCDCSAPEADDGPMAAVVKQASSPE